jgi:hypothetical protein
MLLLYSQKGYFIHPGEMFPHCRKQCERANVSAAKTLRNLLKDGGGVEEIMYSRLLLNVNWTC